MINKKKIIKYTIIFSVILLLFFAFFPYLKALYLTNKYGYMFKDKQYMTDMLDEAEYYQVIIVNDIVNFTLK